MNRLPSLILGSLIVLFLYNCKGDDDGDIQVPRIATDITINLNLPQYSPLNNPGSWAYVEGGSRGIVVYRLSSTDFTAFDRHCTYNVQELCQISFLEATIFEDAECCGSTFEIVSGTPVSGPAEAALQYFNTQFNPNANLLRIYN